jgi:DNA modification methylase
MRLSEHERAELHALIDKGQPLPERYRHLLFAVEGPRLVWARESVEPPGKAPRIRCVEHYGPRSGIAEREGGAWRNRLILGDNGPALAALGQAPDAEAIRRAGGLKLIYIDPPFAVGAEYQAVLEFGAHTPGRPAARVRYPAYHDTWGGYGEAYLTLMDTRLRAMHALLADDGCLFLHCDWRSHAPLRLILDDVFGRSAFVNEIVWYYYNKFSAGRYCLPRSHDTILFYAKNGRPRLHALRLPRSRPARQLVRENVGGVLRNARGADGKLRYRTVADRKLPDVWDIPQLQPASAHWSGFPTQKHHELVARILSLCTQPGDLVADFFAGSGTLPVVAQAMGRRWIACDNAAVAIHVARKRLLKSPQADRAPPTQLELLAAEGAADPRMEGFDLFTCEGAPEPLPASSARTALHARARRTRQGVIVKLTGFTPAPLDMPSPKGNGRNPGADRLSVERGHLVRRNGKGGVVKTEMLTRRWSDWIDYWAVDLAPETAERRAPEGGDAPFHADWWTFRRRGAREIPLQTPPFHLPAAGEVAVMAVDPFGRRATLRVPLTRQ